MNNPAPIIFIHGLHSSGQGFKGKFLIEIFPHLIAPDFTGEFYQRMRQLIDLLWHKSECTLIGSSLGGLMASVYALQYPDKLKKLILLAPALRNKDFLYTSGICTEVPAIVYHGKRDAVIPIREARSVAERIFESLIFHEFDDDHLLHKTMKQIDWIHLIK